MPGNSELCKEADVIGHGHITTERTYWEPCEVTEPTLPNPIMLKIHNVWLV